MSSLSENIQTVINIKDRNTGQLVMEEGVLKETDFYLDHFPADYDKERIALEELEEVQYQKVFLYINDFSMLGSGCQSRVGLGVPWFLFLRE